MLNLFKKTPQKDKAPSLKTTSQTPDAPLEPEDEWSEMSKTALLAVLLALVIRTFLFEPFNIPSGSMYPSLLVGDYLFISKYSYGYSRHSFPFSAGGFDGRILEKHKPERGDVVVFRLPSDTSIDYIKRVIGLPGDTIQMINGQLYINDVPAPRETLGMVKYSENGATAETDLVEYRQTLPEGQTIRIYERSDDEPLDNTEKFTVPEGHYFMMGDNRDNSQDSRVQIMVGFVPEENILGKAQFLFFSTNGKAGLWEVWKWPITIRYDRLFRSVESTTKHD
jgi:signal peptidase I